MLYSIIIPAYNEAKRLPSTIDNIERFLNESELTDKTEIIVVVEKSTDNTLQVVKEYEKMYKNIKYIENDARYGKGYSVKQGVLASKGEYILFTDSDLSVPISFMLVFKNIMYLTKADCCIGSRVQLKKQPFYRLIMGYGFRILTYLIAGLPYKDTQCGFKMFNRRFVDTVFPLIKTNGFAFDVELLMLGKKLGFKINSTRVPWYNDNDSKVSPIKDAIEMFKALLKIAFNIRFKSKRNIVKTE